MKLNLLLLLLVLTSCVPVHVEVAGSLSWGDNQEIDKSSSSKVSHPASLPSTHVTTTPFPHPISRLPE